mmetsp:Transcript_20795/g.44151  ORF Transcript_20795/g.44151 Transcript_20795/m.44151 type:complete len:291 (+) Transcript_20795:122-994(+)
MLNEREKQPEMDRQSDYRKEESQSSAPIQWGSDVDSSNTTGPSITSSSSSSSISTRVSSASTSIGASINISSSAEMVNDDVKPKDITPRHDTSTITTNTNEGQRLTLRSGRWTPDEKILFLYGLRMFGKGRWKKMSVYLPQRSLVQIKSHAQKVLKRQQAGENIFRRLDENYSEIDNLVVQAAQQRDALRMAGIKVHNTPASTKASKCITKKKRLHNQTGTTETVALVATQESSFRPSNITATTFSVNPTSDSSVLAAAALCQLSSIGGNWDKRENKNTSLGGNVQQTNL